MVDFKQSMKAASTNTNGVYKTIFSANKVVNQDSLPLSKKVALGSGLVLGNIATLGLINLGILVWQYNRNPSKRYKRKKNRQLLIEKQVDLIMGAAVNRTPGHAPKAPRAEDASAYMLHVLGEGRRGYEDIVNDPGFLAWWNYFLDPNNFIPLKQQLTTLINDEGLRNVI